MEFSRNQRKNMKNDNVEVRLHAIEAAICRISIAISEGTTPQEFSKEITELKSKLISNSVTPQDEAIIRRTVMLLDPLNGDPWEPF